MLEKRVNKDIGAVEVRISNLASELQGAASLADVRTICNKMTDTDGTAIRTFKGELIQHLQEELGGVRHEPASVNSEVSRLQEQVMALKDERAICSKLRQQEAAAETATKIDAASYVELLPEL